MATVTGGRPGHRDERVPRDAAIAGNICRDRDRKHDEPRLQRQRGNHEDDAGGCVRQNAAPRPGYREHGKAIDRDQEKVIDRDRKSTRLNSSHANISYAVFCLKKKKQSSTIILTIKSSPRPSTAPSNT